MSIRPVSKVRFANPLIQSNQAAPLAVLAQAVLGKRNQSTPSVISQGSSAQNLEERVDQQTPSNPQIVKVARTGQSLSRAAQTVQNASEPELQWVLPADSQQIIFPSGTKYEGQVKDSIPHGQGTLTAPNGSKIEGNFQNGKPHGLVKITKPGGCFVGHVINDARNGQGKMTYENGSKYEGQYKSDLKHGQGKVTYVNGSTCEGIWTDGELCGKVVFRDAQGNPRYEFWTGEKKFLYRLPLWIELK